MKSISLRMLTLCGLFAATLGAAAPTWAADGTTAPASVAGEKVDSGLGDLPHYRAWSDPTGKAPMRTASVVAAAKPALSGEKQDSGLGSLPHYKHWGATAARLPAVQVSQAR